MRTSVFALQTPLLAAAREGFFADEGLEVTFERTVSSSAQLRQLADGDIDVAQTAADNIAGLAASGTGGARVIHVADLGIDQIVVAGRGAASWADVRGGRVAVDAAASGYAYVLYRMLEERGIGRDEYGVQPVGGPPARFDLLCAGLAEVGLLNPYMAARARDRGLSVLGRAADSFPGYPNLVLAVSDTTARNRRPDLRAYVRAVDRGVRWAADPGNSDRAVELLMADRGCGADEARELYDAERGLRTTVCPGPGQVLASLEVVAGLRDEMGGGRAPVADWFAPVADDVAPPPTTGRSSRDHERPAK